MSDRDRESGRYRRAYHQWDSGYQALKRYVDEHGDARVNASYQHPADDLKLGNWVSAQRARYKYRQKLDSVGAKTISDEEIGRLERLGFMWNPRAQDWEEHFQALIEFIGKEGHGRVPPIHRTRSGLGLGPWICEQRQRNKSGDLEDEYRQKLDSVGMVWDPFGEAWEAAFKRLEEDVSVPGDSAVIATFKSDDGFGLGAWVRRQRADCAKGRVDATRISRLEALPGWRWQFAPNRKDAWDKVYMSVQKYEFLTGHCMIPARYKDSTGMIIGAWVYRHRREYKNGTLSPERIRLLEAIPGWPWDSLRSIREVI